MAKDFKDLHTVDAKDMTRDQAMIYILNFFNSRMMTMSKQSVNKTKDILASYDISVSELIDKYVDLVIKNS